MMLIFYKRYEGDLMAKYSLLLIFIFINTAFAKVKVGAAHWVGYTNTDETGIYIELLKEIYIDEDLEFDFSTYKRMTKLFEQKKYDVVVGVTKEDVPSAYYPHWYLDYDHPVNAYFLKSTNNLSSLPDLNNKVLSWFNGYDFEKYIEYDHGYYPVSTVEKAMSLLFNQRIDAFVDYDYNIPEEYKSKLNSFPLVAARPVYLAFSNDKKGKELAAKFDQKMTNLKASGRLKELYKSDYMNTKFAIFEPGEVKIVLSTNDESLLRYNTFGEEKSLVSKLYKLILKKLPDYRIEFVKTSDSENEEQYGTNHCYANKIQALERQNLYLISKPFSLYLAPRLYSKYDLNKYNKTTTLIELLTTSKFRLGISKERILSSNIQLQLENVSELQVKNAAFNTFSRLQQLAMLDEFDLTIEYPSDIATYWHEVTDAEIYSFDLNLKSPFTVGHLMCQRSGESARFVDDFDKVVSKLIQSSEYKEVIRSFAIGLSSERFEYIYQQALLRDMN